MGQKTRNNAWLDKDKIYAPIVIDADVRDFPIIYDKQVVYSFNYLGFKIELFCFFRKNSNKLVICGQDAVQRHAVKLPYFYRWSWHHDIEASFISINDPTLYMNDSLNGGWHQGYKEGWALEAVSDILRRIAHLINVESQNTLLYGISAGGFWALMTATLFPRCTVIVEIPQVDLFLYTDDGPKERMISRCYKGRSIDYIRERYSSRMRVIDRWSEAKDLPRRVWYYQNIKDRSHMRSQVEPFWDEIQSLRAEGKLDLIEDISFRFFNRRTQKGGHIPMEKEDTLSAWRAALNSI
ncbi:hypothetical protein [Mycoplana rhizolycopersici]|uniref:Uncharacterized protein n=1 Tax=Mycoplana rhizolycopersici TaxID=2746702 RepID=A0ABX2QAW8_9HYPH|nr:hypothetical protein [Rhizobium rhizolycopersici]NVP54860.1 hypothetical protein [Rhizobium rhizolycopersici]